jgi:hypothetical protein
MKTDYKKLWKQLANNKQNSAINHFQYCILKALNAKSNKPKAQIALALLRRAFSPKDGTDWSAIYRAGRTACYITSIFDWNISDVLDEVEKEQYKALCQEVLGTSISLTEPDYMFIFVRQDISPEQQAVQVAHATFVAGTKFDCTEPDKVNFVLIGVENQMQLIYVKCLLETRKEYVLFREPDLDDTITAIATQPMKEHEKRFLKRFKLLRF